MMMLKFCTKIMKSKRLSYFYFDMSYVIPDYYYESLFCSFRTDQLIELVQKANSSVPDVIKQ